MGDSDFFLKGYELYPEACVAFATFRAEMIRRLKNVFEQRKTSDAWGPFEPKPGGRPDDGGDSETGWYICAIQSGAIGKKKAAIEIGYLWRPRFEDRSPVVYSKFYCDPEELTRFRYDGSVPEVQAFTEWNHTTLVSPMPRDLDPRRLIGLQLDVLVRVMNGE
jgi:hypothetical protein